VGVEHYLEGLDRLASGTEEGGGTDLLTSRTKRMFLRREACDGIKERAIVGQAVRSVVADVVGVEMALPVQEVLGEGVRVVEDLARGELRCEAAFWEGRRAVCWDCAGDPGEEYGDGENGLGEHGGDGWDGGGGGGRRGGTGA
jgi:hypothetical protein